MNENRLEKMGALDVDKVVHGHQGWRLITCIWLYVASFISSPTCSAFFPSASASSKNSISFSIAIKISVVYIVSGLGGGVLSALFIQSSIFVGASGALFGLLGAMLSELLTNCESSQDGDMLSLICQGNGRACNYTMPNVTDSQIRGLCTQLCT